jgi:hypothetical protein
LEAYNSSIITIMKKEEIIMKSAMGQDDEDIELLLKILPATLASDSASHARAALLSPSTVVRVVWEVVRAASRHSVSQAASQQRPKASSRSWR